MEEYLMGVVAAEMNPNWPQEALAAQTIIARSFTLQKIAEDGGVPARCSRVN
ncbi:MAG: SpoIID/LytB domain-containing protein [Dethiobacter sp.]|nr:SpoIID/LytB domain-containing protein [Dethiobacter sp.]